MRSTLLAVTTALSLVACNTARERPPGDPGAGPGPGDTASGDTHPGDANGGDPIASGDSSTPGDPGQHGDPRPGDPLWQACNGYRPSQLSDGHPCNTNNECQSGDCSAGVCGGGAVTASGIADGMPCSAPTDCLSGTCLADANGSLTTRLCASACAGGCADCFQCRPEGDWCIPAGRQGAGGACSFGSYQCHDGRCSEQLSLCAEPCTTSCSMAGFTCVDLSYVTSYCVPDALVGGGAVDDPCTYDWQCSTQECWDTCWLDCAMTPPECPTGYVCSSDGFNHCVRE